MIVTTIKIKKISTVNGLYSTLLRTKGRGNLTLRLDRAIFALSALIEVCQIQHTRAILYNSFS